MAEDWIGSKNPIYDQHAGTWAMNERRLRGGAAILDELTAFEWEQENGNHFAGRKRQATYINFPDIFATTLTGFLLRESPEVGGGLSFGTLGDVRRNRRIDTPTEAELVYFNTDGVGNDGSQWDNFWMGATRRAMATGHRWMMVESPGERPGTLERILAGVRPYAIEFSPLAVTNWHFERGRLAFAMIKLYRATPRVVDGKMEGQDPDKLHTLLLVRRGFEGLGSAYVGGGWWLFDPENVQIPGEEGRWNSTNGEIPFFPLFYEQDPGAHGIPAMSRPAITELGNLAVSYLNLSSAADFDAWDAAASIQFIIGADQNAFNTATEMIERGAKYAALPANPETGQVPQVYDGSSGAVAEGVFSARLNAKRDEARDIAAIEAAGTPDSSGRSKQAGFADTKAPRLANLAANIEQAQNTMIHFFEQRFGHARPQGSVVWTREFDLLDIREQIRDFFTLATLSGLRAPSVEANAMVLAARQYQLLSEDTGEEVALTEYRAAAERAAEGAQQQGDLFAAFGG